MILPNWKNFRSWPIGRYGPIGVDIGAHTVKAVQIYKTRHQASIIAIASLPRVGETESIRQIAARLSGLLGRQNFHGRDVLLAAPIKKLESELLELPPRSSGAPLESLARAELERSAALTSTPFELASWDVDSDRPSAGTSMMAVALRHADADALVDPFAAEGLTVRAIDTAGCAISRASEDNAPRTTTTAVVDLGWTGFRLVMLAHGRVTYQRFLTDTGLGQMHHEVETRLGVPADIAQFVIKSIGVASTSEVADGAHETTRIDPDGLDPGETIRIRSIIARHVETLSSELKTSLVFAAHRFPETPIKRLIVAGGGAVIPGLANALSARVGVPQERWQSPLCSDPAMMIATGLALYEES